MTAIQLRRFVARAFFYTMILAASRPNIAAASPDGRLPRVEPNDNRHAAGALDQRTLTVALRATVGHWQPEGPAGPALEIEALGEIGKALTVPAPLIRVAEGTQIVASIRNDLAARWSCTASARATARLARTSRGSARSDARSAIRERARRHVPLLGIVDRRARALPRVGRRVRRRRWPRALSKPIAIIVITEWSNLSRSSSGRSCGRRCDRSVRRREAARIRSSSTDCRGRRPSGSTYELGDTVKWRVINLSSQAHPLHLHGFYFDVTASATASAIQPSMQSQPSPRGHAAVAVRRHAGDDVDAGARRQLAVPLSHHASRVARPALGPTQARTHHTEPAPRRSRQLDRCRDRHGGHGDRRHGAGSGAGARSGRRDDVPARRASSRSR